MTETELTNILLKSPAEVVKLLSISSYNLPTWVELEKQYNPLKHKIWDKVVYPDKEAGSPQDSFKRTSLGLQKLAVDRLSQSMFATSVVRDYTYEEEKEKEQIAVDILEELYRTHNYIDSSNIERAKMVNASCQMATVWGTSLKDTYIGDSISKFKLFHRNYSPKDGYTLYPILDGFGELLVLSIAYKVGTVTYMDVFTNTTPAMHIQYKNDKEWAVNAEASNYKLEVFPVVYTYIEDAVWGGLAGTNLVEQLEEMESYEGQYIKDNAAPVFTIDYGEVEPGSVIEKNIVSDAKDSRRLFFVGKGGSVQEVSWAGASEAIDNRYQRVRNAFFEQIQLPDTSFANMIRANTSAENKELIFADAKQKAKDLGGEWEQLFYDELNIVKAFAKVMFPQYATEFDNISVRSTIQPYAVRTKMENAEYIATGGAAMSRATQVRVLGEVGDVAQEVKRIEDEEGATANQL